MKLTEKQQQRLEQWVGRCLPEIEERFLKSRIGEWKVIKWEGQPLRVLSYDHGQGRSECLSDCEPVTADGTLQLYEVQYAPVDHPFECWMDESMRYNYRKPVSLTRLPRRFSLVTFERIPADEA